MKKLFTSFLILVSSYVFSQSPNFEWVSKYGSGANESLNCLATDNSGNIYSTGLFVPNPSNPEIYVSKLNSSGSSVWVKQLGGTSSDWGTTITSDNLGNIYLGGSFSDTADFDPGPGVYNLSGVYNNAFVCKLTTNGDFVWAKKIIGASISSLVMDSLKNQFITGYFWGTVDFDPDIVNTSFLTSYGNNDIFVLKLDSNGTFIWAKQFGGAQTDEGTSIAVDIAGNVFAVGYFFSNPADFDPGITTYSLNSSSGSSFILKLNNNGNLIYVQQYLGGTPNSISIDGQNNAVVQGNFKGTGDFDPGSGVFSMSSFGANSYTDIYVIKLNSNGNLLWAKQIGGTNADRGYDLDIDKQDRIYLTGYFTGVSDFDPATSTYTLQCNPFSGWDIFILNLDPSGNFIWAEQLKQSASAPGTNGGSSIKVDGQLNIYTGGNFFGTCDFDNGSNAYPLSSSGGQDMFIQKMSKSAVGLKEFHLMNDLKVYPNPVIYHLVNLNKKQK